MYRSAGGLTGCSTMALVPHAGTAKCAARSGREVLWCSACRHALRITTEVPCRTGIPEV